MLGFTTWFSLAVIINLILPTFANAKFPLNRRMKSARSQLFSRNTAIPAISLGSASSYSVFASTGIATVPGTVAAGQIVTGDIGVGPIAITAITGFGAVSNGPSSTPFVTGSTYGPPTTGPAKVALAVLTAYNTAYGLQASAANSGLPTNYLDTVGTLKTPGVYKWADTIVLGVNAILTIDGKCGDVYVFQAAGAISTGAGSRIVLTGGLTAATVYWAGATSLTTGVGSVFAGMILTGTNVVIAGSLVGGVYSQTEVALHQATIGLPAVCSLAPVLYYNVVAYDSLDVLHAYPLYVANTYNPQNGGVYLSNSTTIAMKFKAPVSSVSTSPIKLTGTVSISQSDQFNLGFKIAVNPYLFGQLDQFSGNQDNIWLIGAQSSSTLMYPLSVVLTDSNGALQTCPKFYVTRFNSVVMSCVQQEPTPANFFLVRAN